MKQPLDFLKRTPPGEFKDVFLAVVRYESGWAKCSCGWSAPPNREKVQQRAVTRHLDRRHGGSGIHL